MIGYVPFVEREKICFKFIDRDKKSYDIGNFFCYIWYNEWDRIYECSLTIKAESDII